MAGREYALSFRLPDDLAEELQRLAGESRRTESCVAPRAIIEFLEDSVDRRRAAAVLERDKDQPNLTLEEVKREPGLGSDPGTRSGTDLPTARRNRASAPLVVVGEGARLPRARSA